MKTRSNAISALADHALIERVDSLSRLERRNTLEMLLHLVEIDRRKLWRSLEFRSMYDYCIRRLRYSEAAASRRIRTARLIGRYPQVCQRIRDGRLSLCAVAKIARAVVEDGRVELIQQIEGKRLDQIDAILATHRNPSRPVRESIRLLCVERRVDVPGPGPAAPRLEPAPGMVVEASSATAPGPGGGSATAPGSGAGAAPGSPTDSAGGAVTSSISTGQSAVHDQNDGRKLTRIERVFRFQFGIDAETMTKFARVQSIAARRAGRHVDLSELFGVLCEAYLHRYDAAMRSQRRAASERRNARVTRGDGNDRAHGGADRRTSSGAVHATEEPAERLAGRSGARPRSRHVPDAVRDAVIRRDGGRCTFVDRNGERCTETIALQIDHIRPHALGGGNDITNLRSMCFAHNRLLAERTFGRQTVQRAIESSAVARTVESAEETNGVRAPRRGESGSPNLADPGHGRLGESSPGDCQSPGP